MALTRPWLAAAALVFASVPVHADEPAVRFSIDEGGNQNRFYQSPEVAYHVRLTNPENPRVIMAFPAGNSGASFSFDPSFRENQGLRFTNVETSPWTAKGGPGRPALEGAQVSFQADRSSIVLSQTILDSMRMIRTSTYRSYPEKVAVREQLAAALGESSQGWVEAVAHVRGNTITFTRSTYGGENHYAGSLRFSGPVRIEKLAGGMFRITRTDGKPLEVTAEAGNDYEPLTPLRLDELLNKDALRHYDEALAVAKDPHASAAARNEASQLIEAVNARRFLTYKEKLLAGSHRFNTYFGRDTALATLLASPMLTSEVKKAALASILDRISATGVVAHEEDIGGQAEQRHIEEALDLLRQGKTDEAKALLEHVQDPIYDYKMVDGELLVPFLARELFSGNGALSKKERDAFLDSRSAQGPTYREQLVKVFRRAVTDTLPFAKSHDARDLIRFKEGTVGDWRDSKTGNGLGVYSGGVNAHLAPFSLDAIAQLLASDAFPESDRALFARILDRSGFTGDLAQLAKEWQSAREHFQVNLSPDEARARLESFLGQVPAEARAYYERQKVDGAVTLGEWLEGAKAPSLDAGVSFQALALDDNRKAIDVPFTDVALDLYFGKLTPAQVKDALQVLERPFPLGLKTEMGELVSNPAMSNRDGDWTMFNRGGYHGTVIWEWQDMLVREGLARQAELMAGLGTSEGLAVAKEAASLYDDLVAARAASGDLANSELRTIEIGADGKMHAIAYSPGISVPSEASPAQHWSTGAVAELMTKIRMGRGSTSSTAASTDGFARTLDRGFARTGSGASAGSSLLDDRRRAAAAAPGADER